MLEIIYSNQLTYKKIGSIIVFNLVFCNLPTLPWEEDKGLLVVVMMTEVE